MRPMGEILVAANAAYGKWQEYESNRQLCLFFIFVIPFMLIIVLFDLYIFGCI
jgi:hypothetical protein